ncbi:MAG: MFS transporter [Euzebya sp.]
MYRDSQSNGHMFRRLWASTAAANLADGILLAGLPVVMTTLTTQPAVVAGVQVAIMGPMAMTALPAGVLADRMDRRLLLVAANLIRALGLAVVVVAAWREEWRVAAVYAAAVLAGSTEILADSAAETSVPALVGHEGLQRAHARLVGTQMVAGDAVGAPIGSWFATIGIGWVLGVPAALYTVAAEVARRLHQPLIRPVERVAQRCLRRDIREGMTLVWHDPLLRRIGLANSAMNLGNTAFFAVAVLIIIGPVGLPRAAYGLVLAVLAAGGVVGSMSADRAVRTLGQVSVIRAGAIVTGAAYGLICLTANPVVTMVAAFGIGMFGMMWNITNRVLRQQATPDHLLGRVTATMKVMALVMTPLGGILGGVVAQVAGVRSVGYVAVGAAVVAWALMMGIDGSSSQMQEAPIPMRGAAYGGAQ